MSATWRNSIATRMPWCCHRTTKACRAWSSRRWRPVWRSRQPRVATACDGCSAKAATERSPHAAMRLRSRARWNGPAATQCPAPSWRRSCRHSRSSGPRVPISRCSAESAQLPLATRKKSRGPGAGTGLPHRLAARAPQQGHRMSEPILLPICGNEIALLPQDRRPAFNWTRVLTIVLSLLVIAAALYQMRSIEPDRILRLVPASPSFWLLFLLGFMAGPLSEWFIFNRLWGVGLPALGALTRKLVFNELLLGYLGEAWFYAWARKNSRVEAAPFGAVKDVAILSAMAGNLMTLAMIALAIPFLDLLPLGEHRAAIGWSLAFVIGTSLAATIWRKSLFSLTSSELHMVFAAHMARILATTLISAVLWFMVLPDTPIGWWLVLAA